MNRIETIASLVDNDALVVDIGTDHAYLPIYLYENDITKNIVASDISSNALLFAKSNLEKHNLRGKIKLVVSDGFKNLDECFDIAIISGVGTETIKKILDNEVLPNKLILSSHKNVSDLREYMFKIGYKIEKEIIVYENNIYYNIIKYIKGKDNLKLPEKDLCSSRIEVGSKVYINEKDTKDILVYSNQTIFFLGKATE